MIYRKKRMVPGVLGSILFFICIVLSCQSVEQEAMKMETSINKYPVPKWASTAIWYQIFVERFRNGDPTNDPIRESLDGAWPDHIPESWEVTPWTKNWYQPDAWFSDCEEEQFYHGIQARRYGGDLQGVLDKLDYLEELGINAIYFNPLNHAPSLHKYDPTYYHHIDAHFGPDPVGDLALIAQENPGDINTWTWTSADKMFLSILKKCHEKGIRVIMDYSWNHSGRTFWAFQEVMKNGDKSPYKDWYYIHSFDDPDTDENEFAYKSWFGATTLPEFKEDLPNGHLPDGVMRAMEGNLHSESLKQHIRDVTKRWMDPDGDGDPSDGVDGFRMDVAAEIPVGFWEEYGAYVKKLNPNAILIGELWYEQWPDKLLDPIPFFDKGFDANMNYRWYRAARRFFAKAGEKYSPSAFSEAITKLYAQMDKQNQYALMNLVSGHDSPRVLTSLFNKGKYKQGAGAKDNPEYKIHRPDDAVYQELKLLLVHQFTFVGAPHIWNGDELGMWGSDDPDCRKPIWWSDLEFEDEAHYVTKASSDKVEKVAANEAVLDFYKGMIRLRKQYPVLSTGDFEFVLADDEKDVLVYSRYDESSEIIVCFNLSDQRQQIEIPTRFNSNYTLYPERIKVDSEQNNRRTIAIDSKSYQILISEK